MDTEEEIAALIEGTGGGVRRISYDVLSQATNSFSNDAVLEESYGGVVYKASFRKPNGSEVVAAVKKLRGPFPEQTKKEFLREIASTGNLSHRYLVPLLGWCDERDELLLVYHVSLPIHSLDRLVFDDVLCWADRFGIACGLASGVDYLHTGSNKCVIHRDIKPGSVMLDPNRTPKLGNFWLARVCGHGEGINATLAWGTHDYMDPEIYHEGEKASKDSDVYSFGIVALELATGRRHERLRSLVSQVWRLHEAGKIVEAVGEGLRGSAGFDESQARRLLVAGLWCCHTRGWDRPKLMKQVIAVLHGYTSLSDVRLKPMDAYLKHPLIWPFTSQDSGQVGPHMVVEGESSGVIVNQEAAAPRKFSHDELHQATNGFRWDNVLGSGTGGVVYVGELGNEKVAVKKLAPDFRQQSDEELHVEISNTCNLIHRNLVKLIGWCSHVKRNGEKETLLVLEHMPRLSLDKHLFGDPLNPISWGDRFKIACGLAEGVDYLHTGSHVCVIHRDIKPENVMLDQDWTPKLGDFGSSRLSDHGKSMKTTVIGGTLSYIAPEVQSGEKASMKSDVYSFGKVAVEIVTGKTPRVKPPKKMSLLVWVWNLHAKKENDLIEAVDEKLQLSEPDEIEEARRLLVVGLWCCNRKSSRRPEMEQVIAVLHGHTPLSEAVAQVEEQKDYFAGLDDDISELSITDSGHTYIFN